MAGEDLIVSETAAKETPDMQETPVNARTMSSEDIKRTLYGEPEKQEMVSAEPEKKEEVKDTKKEGKDTVIPEKAGDKPPENQEQQPEMVSKQEHETLKGEIEQLKNTLAARERFYNRQATELGLLRKTSPEEEKEAIRQANEKYEQIYVQDGKFAADEFMDNFRAERKQRTEALQKASEIERYEAQTKDTKEKIATFVPDFDNKIDVIVKLMEEDRAAPENIRIFRENPYIVDPVTLYNMAKRADLKTQVDTLTQENTALKARVEELKKQPGELAQKIADATNSLDGKSSGVATPPAAPIDLTGVNVRRIPLDRLREMNKQFSKT
jgi:uncharacterized phage infection (PIP) family protein YhgE